MHPSPASPSPADPRRASRWAADGATVVALVAATVAAVVLLGVGVASALCGDSGECRSGEASRGGWTMLAAVALFGVAPVVAAVVRRNGWWLLWPLVPVGLATAVGGLATLGGSL